MPETGTIPARFRHDSGTIPARFRHMKTAIDAREPKVRIFRAMATYEVYIEADSTATDGATPSGIVVPTTRCDIGPVQYGTPNLPGFVA